MGSESDLIYAVVMIFVAAIVVVFAFYINEQITVQFAASGIPTFALGHSANALKTFNYSIILITVAFAVVTFIAAMMIKSHPMFFVASLISLIVLLLVVIIMANIYDRLMIDSIFRATATGTFSKMFNWVRNMPKIFVIIWGLLAVGLYAKNKEMI